MKIWIKDNPFEFLVNTYDALKYSHLHVFKCQLGKFAVLSDHDEQKAINVFIDYICNNPHLKNHVLTQCPEKTDWELVEKNRWMYDGGSGQIIKIVYPDYREFFSIPVSREFYDNILHDIIIGKAAENGKFDNSIFTSFNFYPDMKTKAILKKVKFRKE